MRSHAAAPPSGSSHPDDGVLRGAASSGNTVERVAARSGDATKRYAARRSALATSRGMAPSPPAASTRAAAQRSAEPGASGNAPVSRDATRHESVRSVAVRPQAQPDFGRASVEDMRAARSAGTMGGAHVPAGAVAASSSEKVLLRDDVMPLQTASQRAQQQADAASDADDLNLIDRAASLLRAGEPTEALALLQEHGRRFPASQLKLERRGLSVLARCAAGQLVQGRRERAEFLHEAAGAPIAARVRRACVETQP